MEKVSWMDRKTNDEVLAAVGERRSLMEKILKVKKNWIGHVLRGNGLFKDVMEGRFEGKRPKGRPRIGILEDLMESSYENMKRKAQDRKSSRCWLPWTCREAENS